MNSLAGKRILVTRPRSQADGLIQSLSLLGAVPILFPTIEIVFPAVNQLLDQAILNLNAYRWVIFTSVNGVLAFWQRLEGLGKDSLWFGSVQVAAIGPATALSLSEKGIKPGFVPDEYIAEAILNGLGDIRGQRILLPRAEKARKALADELVKSGAFPEEIPAYQTFPVTHTPQELAELKLGIDIATFTSASTVDSFFEVLSEDAYRVLDKAVIACIGPITADTAQRRGLTVHVVAEEYTTIGLLKALSDYLNTKKMELAHE